MALRLDATGGLEQLRFNEYDRGDMHPEAFSEFLPHWCARARAATRALRALARAACPPRRLTRHAPTPPPALPTAHPPTRPPAPRCALVAMVNREELVLRTLLQPGECLVS